MRRNPVLEELGSYAIGDLAEKARAMRGAGERVIDFSIGDPREPTPPFILEALRQAVPEVSQYPTVPGTAELRGAVADYLLRRFGVAVDPDHQVLPTSGSKEAIFHTPLAFIDRDHPEAVVFGSPSYPVYHRGARFAGADSVGIPLSGDFVLRAADISSELWDRAAMVWSCSPHNPTGATATAADLLGLVETARATETLLMSDECYTDLYEGEPPASALQLSGDDFSGVLAFFSCSKRSGMTGYRSGAMVGDADLIAAVRKLRGSVGAAPPEFVQAAAAAAWADDDHAAARREIFAEKRRVLAATFDRLGYRVAGGSDAIYLWVEVPDDISIAETLLEAGVIVSPGRVFGDGGEGYVRLALVPTVEECEAATEVLTECLPKN
ncbi:MAG: aminotransferase class I/II-fold pyridoxal phosphate-dependent enzyme [Acidimicrobiia bacterium]